MSHYLLSLNRRENMVILESALENWGSDKPKKHGGKDRMEIDIRKVSQNWDVQQSHPYIQPPLGESLDLKGRSGLTLCLTCSWCHVQHCSINVQFKNHIFSLNVMVVTLKVTKKPSKTINVLLTNMLNQIIWTYNQHKQLFYILFLYWTLKSHLDLTLWGPLSENSLSFSCLVATSCLSTKWT